MTTLQHLFDSNRRWAASITASEPDFFTALSKQQSPNYLWIGCSDSRVPANQIVDLPPGEVFVHRNVANLVLHSDLNCLSVLQYAVEVLQVDHIIVCGHYGCGGIKAALDHNDHGLIDNWLRPIRRLAHDHANRFEGHTVDELHDAVCELNVIEQVTNVCHTTIVQNAWKAGSRLTVHGWIYRIETGILEDLGACVTSNEDLELLE